MKISVDDVELFRLTEVQKKVIKNDISSEIFDEDMKRRLQYILMHKYEKCMERLSQEWMPKLASRVSQVPTDKDALAQLIFSQEDYKDRTQKDREYNDALAAQTASKTA